jgi:hypothetical protein
MNELYKVDFYAWTVEQATLLRDGRLTQIVLRCPCVS